MKEKSVVSKQGLFLSRIEELLEPSTSLVYELSEILGISSDSAYRRMRGETLLNIDEVIKLCEFFNISFDVFTRPESGLVAFSYSGLESKTDGLYAYLTGLYKDLGRISMVPDSRIIYACQDIPVFYHYNYKEIAAFKFFYWMRSIMNVSDLEPAKYEPHLISDEIYDTAKRIYELYAKVNTTEIWTDSTIQSTIKQIGFYWESGVFLKKDDALAICESLRMELADIQKLAENPVSNSNAQVENSGGRRYELYFSEIEITNNCVLVNMGKTRAVYLSHFSFYTMKTLNQVYSEKTEEWLNSLIKKTTLISGVSEKIRFQFFNRMYKSIDALVARIKAD